MHSRAGQMVGIDRRWDTMARTRVSDGVPPTIAFHRRLSDNPFDHRRWFRRIKRGHVQSGLRWISDRSQTNFMCSTFERTRLFQMRQLQSGRPGSAIRTRSKPYSPDRNATKSPLVTKNISDHLGHQDPDVQSDVEHDSSTSAFSTFIRGPLNPKCVSLIGIPNLAGHVSGGRIGHQLMAV
jgi:hypothetical protein